MVRRLDLLTINSREVDISISLNRGISLISLNLSLHDHTCTLLMEQVDLTVILLNEDLVSQFSILNSTQETLVKRRDLLILKLRPSLTNVDTSLIRGSKLKRLRPVSVARPSVTEQRIDHRRVESSKIRHCISPLVV